MFTRVLPEVDIYTQKVYTRSASYKKTTLREKARTINTFAEITLDNSALLVEIGLVCSKMLLLHKKKKPYRSHFFTRRCSYVFYFFTRISSTRLKFTRELSRKDGKQIQIRYRYRYSRFGVTQLLSVETTFKNCLYFTN